MIIKITDGETSHFVECYGEVNVSHHPAWIEGDECDNEGITPWTWFADHEPDEEPPVMRDIVIIRPCHVVGGPRSIYTDLDVYLLNDTGKTIEVIHRCK